MFQRKMTPLLLACLLFSAQAFAAVPSVRFRRPDVPGFLQSMDLQTVQMQVFPREASGMAPDLVGDLSWNPAFLADLSQKTAYLDFLSQESSPLFSTQGMGIPYDNARSSSGEWITPRWYPQTTVKSVQTVPLYNFGIMLPLSPRLKVALFNTTVFDYGPFLQGYSSSWEGAASDSKMSNGGLTPQRLEIDHNQQTVLGNKVELVAAYSLSAKWDAGIRLGHMVYDRHGDLVDDRWAKYPHSSYGVLEDESLKIRGHHVEAGLGLTFRPDSTMRFGIFGGFLSGNGSEKSFSRDTSCAWSETDVNTKYYDKNYSFLDSDGFYEETGIRPRFSLTFEKKWSSKWILRAFVSGSWSNVDVKGTLAGSDTTAGDRTYDYYEVANSIHFRRLQSHGSRAGVLTGDGTEESRLWNGFISLSYAPRKHWSLFGGIHVQNFTYRQNFGENAFYRSHRWDEYSLYKPENSRDASYQETVFSMKSDYTRWSFYIPAGLRVHVVRGLSVLAGTGVAFALEDQSAEGERLYPVKTSRKWKDGKPVVDDVETDRYEVFSSNPAKVLNRQWGRYFGITYQHPSGAVVYLKFADDVSKMDNWTFGFEIGW
jgi:hypothetical protein